MAFFGKLFGIGNDLTDQRAQEIYERDQKNMAIAMQQATQNQQNLYAQSLQQASVNTNYGNYYGPYTTTTGGAGIGLPGVTTGITGTYATANAVPGTVNVIYGTGQATYNPQHIIYTPEPSGMLVDVHFIDATGSRHIMTIDQSYLDMISKISLAHNNFLASKPKILPDPDFDLDELAQASELVESLDGARPEG